MRLTLELSWCSRKKKRRESCFKERGCWNVSSYGNPDTISHRRFYCWIISCDSGFQNMLRHSNIKKSALASLEMDKLMNLLGDWIWPNSLYSLLTTDSLDCSCLLGNIQCLFVFRSCFEVLSFFTKMYKHFCLL